ncbi:hypothetical protein [Spirosoma koreense]
MPTDPTASLNSVDLSLLTILNQMVSDVADPHAHYMVSANYIDFVDSARLHIRRYMCPIYVHADSASQFDFDPEGILLDTFFSPEKGTLPERIHIPFSQIYRVAKCPAGGMFVDKDIIYEDSSKFKMPPLQ